MSPDRRRRVCATTCAVRANSTDSSSVARRSRPAARPVTVRRARLPLRSTAWASRAACSASWTSSPVTRATVCWACSRLTAPRRCSFEANCRTRREAARRRSRNRVRVAPPTALTRATTRPILPIALARSPESVGYSTSADTTVVSARTFPNRISFCSFAFTSNASFSCATASAPHRWWSSSRWSGAVPRRRCRCGRTAGRTARV